MIIRINKLIIPLAIALLAMVVFYFVLPAGVEAGDIQPGEGVPLFDSVLLTLPDSLGGTGAGPSDDNKISRGSGSVPEIAANTSYAAVVYVENNNVYLVSADDGGSGWYRTLLASAQGASVPVVPKVAISGTNTAHAVWNSADGQYIRHVACTLAGGKAPDCGVVNAIVADTVNGGLQMPDMAIDAGKIHVVWFDSVDGHVWSSYATAVATNTVTTWDPANDIIDFSSNYSDQGSLAIAVDNQVHVAVRAFLGSPTNEWNVYYRELSIADHSPTDNASWNMGATDKIFNVALAAGGDEVFLSWDTWYVNGALTPTIYSLYGVSGSNFGAVNDPNPTHITSGTGYGTDNSADHKHSQAPSPNPTPIEERSLRPSVAFDGSAFSVVWQQRPNVGGGGGSSSSIIANDTNNCTSEIFYASPHTLWVEDQLSSESSTPSSTGEYSIDPDIAIDNSGGERHVVFMKADDNACVGGDLAGNAIYYRGPFEGSLQLSGVYLPIIMK